MKDITKVIFRVFADGGDVIALFPEIPSDIYGHHCMSYCHVGQHSAASLDYLSVHTTLATEEQFSPLKAELEKIGYNLEIRKRVTAGMDRARMEAL